MDALHSKRAIRANFVVEFGGSKAIDGTILFTTDGARSRIEHRNGTVWVFDGAKAWSKPGEAKQMSRFHTLTWPYFALAAFKLQDGGATLTPEGKRPLNGQEMLAARLTFAPGTGDAPDDWYLLHIDPKTHQLRAMAYIVTYGKTREAGEKEPHAIVYDGFETIDGVTLSTAWTFHNWSSEAGITGDAIGRATLSDVQFVDPAEDAFRAPEGAAEDPLPAK